MFSIVLLYSVVCVWSKYIKPSEVSPPRDKNGKIVECPAEGNAWEFEHLGNRFLYEGELQLSRACYLRSLDERFEVGRKGSSALIEEKGNGTHPIVALFESEAHFRRTFPRSAGIPHEIFASIEDTSALMRREIEKASQFDREIVLQQIRHRFGRMPSSSHMRGMLNEYLERVRAGL